MSTTIVDCYKCKFAKSIPSCAYKKCRLGKNKFGYIFSPSNHRDVDNCYVPMPYLRPIITIQFELPFDV